ncbi:MAG: hypothetical protein WAN43_00360 [Rhodomicrobium sp.]
MTRAEGQAAWVRGLQFTGAAIAAALFMSPAVLLNLMSMNARGPAWVFMTVVLVMGGAWLTHDARQKRVVLSGALALIVVGVSLVTAVRNIGGLREAGAEVRSDAIKARDAIAERRVRLEGSRKAQTEVPGVGDTAASVFESEIEAEKKANPWWKSSKECTDATTLGSQILCEKIGKLTVKLKAAKARDGFQRQIDELDKAPAQAVAVPLPTADNGAIIRMAGWLGVHPTSGDVDQSYEIVLVLAYELLAAVMPAIAFRSIVSAPAAAEAETGAAEQEETPTGNDEPAPPRKRRKQSGNGERKSPELKAGNAEGALILPFRKRRPTPEEISAMKASGKTYEEIAAELGYTTRQLRNIRKGNSGSPARQAA